jgi:hypothetical protein
VSGGEASPMRSIVDRPLLLLAPTMRAWGSCPGSCCHSRRSVGDVGLFEAATDTDSLPTETDSASVSVRGSPGSVADDPTTEKLVARLTGRTLGAVARDEMGDKGVVAFDAATLTGGAAQAAKATINSMPQASRLSMIATLRDLWDATSNTAPAWDTRLAVVSTVSDGWEPVSCDIRKVCQICVKTVLQQYLSFQLRAPFSMIKHLGSARA